MCHKIWWTLFLLGQITNFITGWKPERPFPMDMSGFAVNLSLILSKPNAVFNYSMKKGYLESEFLSFFITREELEPLADNCTKIYVWHTRTERTAVRKVIPDFEV